MRGRVTTSGALPDDVVYKEVVVIGNGPSGISVSHQLAGHWACLQEGGAPWEHPDSMLQARLQGCPSRPLPLQSLGELAEGLEGRSTNPIPLLVDSLIHPGADMGANLPSMLDWKYFPERQIEHVVLGRGRPGGLWHSLDPGVVTLSPARWMALPSLPELSCTSPESRASVPAVAAYYEKYVAHTGIQRYFRNNTLVTSVRPIKLVGKLDSAELGAPLASAAWCVCGYDTLKKEPFRYVCSHVILATGASDRPNSLEGRGKRPQGLPGAIRTPPKLKEALDAMEKLREIGAPEPLPVLVIGSGLSAADALLRLRSGGFRVAHAYRGASTALRSLPPDLYPEYHEVYKMMKEGSSSNHPLYTALPDHILLEISHNGKVVEDYDEEDNIENLSTPRRVKLLNTKTNVAVDLDVSLCVILIGSRPDLSFLPDDFETNYITWNVENKNLKTDVLANGNASIKKESLMNGNSRREQSFEKSLDNEGSKKLMPHPTEMCIKCSYKNQIRPKESPVNNKQCFLKTQWYNLKYIVGQGLQKTRQDERMNGKVDLTDKENQRLEKLYGKKSLNVEENKTEMENNSSVINKSVQNVMNIVDESKRTDVDSNGELQGSGLGLGVHPEKPIDCRTNPLSIDKESHTVLNAPKGLYALGPLTGDNFVRFIPGGALAIVSNIWKEKKSESNVQDCGI